MDSDVRPNSINTAPTATSTDTNAVETSVSMAQE
jgi:hypothetical protein